MDENNNQEIMQQMNDNFNLATNQVIESIARTDEPEFAERRYRVARVITEMDDQKRKVVFNSIAAAVSTAVFGACAIAVSSQLGIQAPDIDYTFNGSGFLQWCEGIVTQIAALNEMSKEVFSFENIKSMLLNLGPVGYISAAFALMKTKNIASNISKINNLNKEFAAMEVAYPCDCEYVRKSLSNCQNALISGKLKQPYLVGKLNQTGLNSMDKPGGRRR